MGLFDRWFKKDAVPGSRALETMLRNLAQKDTAEQRAALYNLLKQSTLILATPHENPDTGPRVSDGSTEIGFIVTADANGKTAMLVFTSEAALLAWRPVGCTYTAMSARNVFQWAMEKEIETIIINPNGPAGGYLTRPEITALAEGLSPGAAAQNIPKGTELVITTPEPAPADEWIAPLRSYAQTTTAIRGLFVVTASIGGGPPHYLVGVDLAADSQPDAVIPPLIQAIQSKVEAGAYVDFIPLDDDSLAGEIRARGLRIF
jgi:hypothetical protein